jgi:hypothetical protein
MKSSRNSRPADLVRFPDGSATPRIGRLLGETVAANLAAPRKRKEFEALHARIGISALDAGEEVTLDFKRGELLVRRGLMGDISLAIRGDSESIMDLTRVPAGLGGMPDFLSSHGRRFLAKLLTRRIRVDGLRLQFALFNRLNRVLSVN